MAKFIDTALPSSGSVSWYTHYQALDTGVRAQNLRLWQIDEFAGASDDAKHVAAWAAASSATSSGYDVVLQYPQRTFGPLSTPIAVFSGMRAIGPAGNDGVKNLELNRSPHKVTVTAGSGTSALFVQSNSYNDIVFADIAWSGNASSQWWHNTNGSSYSIYPALFHSLSFDGFLNVMGNDSQKFTITQTVFSGHWTVLNYSGTPLHIGGSDCSLWEAGFLNSNSPASVSGAGKPIVHFDYLEKTQVGYMYLTAENNWTGLKVTGPVARRLYIKGGTYEGRAAGNPATYPVIDITGGHVILDSPHVGYVVMTNTAGVMRQSGGVLEVRSPHYLKATAAAATDPLLYQTAGIANLSRPLSGDGNACYFRDSGGSTTTFPYPTANSVTQW